MKVTSPHSFTLFLERNHSFGVFHGSQFFTKRSEYAPRDHSPCRKKKMYSSGKNERGTVKLVNSFILALSLLTVT